MAVQKVLFASKPSRFPHLVSLIPLTKPWPYVYSMYVEVSNKAGRRIGAGVFSIIERQPVTVATTLDRLLCARSLLRLQRRVASMCWGAEQGDGAGGFNNFAPPEGAQAGWPDTGSTEWAKDRMLG